MTRQRFLKLFIAIIASCYFLWCSYDYEHGSIFAAINIPTHEAGHGLFSIFGNFMNALGGTFCQILLPLIFFFCLIYKKKPFGASLMLFWIATAVLHTSAYIGDSIDMVLPAINISFSGEEGTHDWNYLLSEMNILEKAPQISKIVYIIGVIITFAGVIGSFYYIKEDDEVLFETEK